MEKENSHITTQYHKDAMLTVSDFRRNYINPANQVNVQLDQVLAERIPTYKKIVTILAEVVNFMGKQNMAFRGHR